MGLLVMFTGIWGGQVGLLGTFTWIWLLCSHIAPLPAERSHSGLRTVPLCAQPEEGCFALLTRVHCPVAYFISPNQTNFPPFCLISYQIESFVFTCGLASTSKKCFIQVVQGPQLTAGLRLKGEDSLLFLPGFVLLPAAGTDGRLAKGPGGWGTATCSVPAEGRWARGRGGGGALFILALCPACGCRFRSSRRWCLRVSLRTAVSPARGWELHLISGQCLWLEVKNITLGTAASLSVSSNKERNFFLHGAFSSLNLHPKQNLINLGTKVLKLIHGFLTHRPKLGPPG